MADTIMTLTQLENLFQSQTSGILGTSDPSAVRISWPTDGAPSFSITQDVCFVRVEYGDDPYTRQRVREYTPADSTDATESTIYTAVIDVTWYLYGPNSFDNAALLRDGLFQDTTTQTLSASNVYLVADVAQPSRIPELFNGQWWNRSMLRARFNEKVVRQATVPYLQSGNVQLIEG